MDSNTPPEPRRTSKGRVPRAIRSVGRVGTWLAGASRSTLLGILAGVVVVGAAAYAAANFGGFNTVRTAVPTSPTTKTRSGKTATPPMRVKAPTAAALRLPVAGAVEAPFGWVYSTRLSEWYYNPGVTLKANVGDLVHAGWAGTVTAVGQEPLMGLTVEVDDGTGFTTWYGDLGSARVKVGDYVKQGDVLGTVASPSLYTRQTGSHVDFQVFHDGKAMDPSTLMRSSS
jgi:murein DD-endopeptidase MepM/ murein hydrolase activator NlpD